MLSVNLQDVSTIRRLFIAMLVILASVPVPAVVADGLVENKGTGLWLLMITAVSLALVLLVIGMAAAGSRTAVGVQMEPILDGRQLVTSLLVVGIEIIIFLSLAPSSVRHIALSLFPLTLGLALVRKKVPRGEAQP